MKNRKSSPERLMILMVKTIISELFLKSFLLSGMDIQNSKDLHLVFHDYTLLSFTMSAKFET